MGATGGTHHSWGTVAGDTVSGAAAGATFGPVGAVVGAGAGFLTGLLTGDNPDPLAPPAPPPQAPDMADVISKRADMAKQMRLLSSGTGNFLSGPLGDTSGTKAG